MMLSATAVSSPAALLVYEGFDYELGSPLVWEENNVQQGMNGGQGFGNPWRPSAAYTGEIVSGLTYNGLLTSGNALRFDFGVNRRTDDIRGGVTWASFLMKADDDALLAGANQFRGIELQASSAIGGARIGAWTDSEGSYFGVHDTRSSVPFLAGTTYLVVASITWNTVSGAPETINVYVNPNLDGSGPGELVATAQFNIQTLNGNVGRIFHFSLYGPNDNDFVFDEFRIGDTFADVTPVPEVSTTLLLIVGFFGVGARRVLKCRRG